MSTAKKGCRQGPAFAIVCIRGSLVKERFHSDSTSTKIIGKSHRKNPTFYVFTPWLILYFVGIVEGRYRNFSRRKIQKFKKLNIHHMDCNDHRVLFCKTRDEQSRPERERRRSIYSHARGTRVAR